LQNSDRELGNNPISEHCPYVVGYGKPPVASRFQKGRSGNPRGRPKSSKGLEAKLSDQLNTLIAVIDGEQIVLTKKEALVRALIKRALAGDVRAIEIALQQARTEPNEENDGVTVIIEDEDESASDVDGKK
jgi:hypothetical protein